MDIRDCVQEKKTRMITELPYPKLSMQFLLMLWLLKETLLMWAWYWPNKPEYSTSCIGKVKCYATIAMIQPTHCQSDHNGDMKWANHSHAIMNGRRIVIAVFTMNHSVIDIDRSVGIVRRDYLWNDNQNKHRVWFQMQWHDMIPYTCKSTNGQ